MTPQHVLEFGFLSIMILGPGIVVYSRARKQTAGETSPRGVGARVIQLVSALLFGPLIGILTLEGRISGETAGALLGVALGYTLSGVEKAVPKNDRSKNQTKG